MRYLLFNLVVFAALAYLITGDGADPQSWFEDRLQNLNPGAWFDQRRDTPQTVAAPVATPAPAPTIAPQIAPQPVDTIADKTEAVSPPVHEAPIPAPVVAEAAPPVAEPRDTAAPVAYEAPVIAEAPTSTEQPAFMTRSERRRELNRLIQDMEGQFLDRLGE